MIVPLRFGCAKTLDRCIQDLGIIYKRGNAVGSGGAKSSSEYRARYGKSDMDRFMVRPGIAMRVDYAGNGTACQLEIAPAEPLVEDSRPISFPMAESEVREIENELVPPNSRSAKVHRGGSAQRGLHYSESEDYAEVSIGRWLTVCKQTEKCIQSSTIQSEKKECTSLIDRTGSPPGVFSSEGTAR